jgi:Holliday junction resolvase RusA-like endonuclease
MTLRFSELPPSTNNLYVNAGRRRVLSPRARTYKNTIGWEGRRQYRGKPLTGELCVEVQIFWPDRRRHDIDNGLKALFDSLTGIIYEDDSQIADAHVIRFLGSKTPGVEMRVSAL